MEKKLCISKMSFTNEIDNFLMSAMGIGMSPSEVNEILRTRIKKKKFTPAQIEFRYSELALTMPTTCTRRKIGSVPNLTDKREKELMKLIVKKMQDNGDDSVSLARLQYNIKEKREKMDKLCKNRYDFPYVYHDASNKKRPWTAKFALFNTDSDDQQAKKMKCTLQFRLGSYQHPFHACLAVSYAELMGQNKKDANGQFPKDKDGKEVKRNWKMDYQFDRYKESAQILKTILYNELETDAVEVD